MRAQFLLIQVYMRLALNISALPLLPTHTSIPNDAHPIAQQISGVCNSGVKWHMGTTEAQDHHPLYPIKHPQKSKTNSQFKHEKKMMKVRKESDDQSELTPTHHLNGVENHTEVKPSLEACLSLFKSIGRIEKESESTLAYIERMAIKGFLIYLIRGWLEGLWARYDRYRRTPF